MARIRSIKPETWTDPQFVLCSPLARLLWIGSWNLADDQGVLKDEPVRLRLAILPGDDVDAEMLVEELVTARLLLRKRTVEGDPVLVIRTFREHQKIDQRREGKYGDADDLVDCGTFDEVMALNGSHRPAPSRDPARQSAPTRAGPRPNATERDHTIKEGIKDQGSLSVVAVAPKDTEKPKKRATRVPDPFTVSESLRDWVERELPGVNWKFESSKFLDHFRSANDKTGLKRDWDAAWRNWMRNNAEGKFAR